MIILNSHILNVTFPIVPFLIAVWIEHTKKDYELLPHKEKVKLRYLMRELNLNSVLQLIGRPHFSMSSYFHLASAVNINDST